MDEKKRQLRIILIKLPALLICAGLYAWGGMEHKWLRRFLAPFVCFASMFSITKDWRTLGQMFLLMLTQTLGYGAHSLWMKIFKRGLYGGLNGISSSFFNFVKGKDLLVFIQIGLLITMYVLFGVWNPVSARAEETILGLFLYAIPILTTGE